MVRSSAAQRGFTLVELLITLAILGLLAGLAVPTIEIVAQRKKEQELRAALREIRSAIDAYKLAVDEGKIAIQQNESGYPPRIEMLYEGVLDNSDPTRKKKIFFLRQLPRDPFYPDRSAPPAQTWLKRSYASDYNDPKEGADVYDVRSLSSDVGLNGVPYKEW